MATLVDDNLKAQIRSFNERGQVGPDPLAARYAERRAAYSLFARMTFAWRRDTERLLSTGVRSMSGRIPVTGSALPIVVSSPRLKKNEVPLATSTRRWRPRSAGCTLVVSICA